ncbi:MAG TPA: DUF3313 domain-containing protein [Candidatus Binataceae bacterium]|jgi:hypothetical protein|nr:DUF3313 domain-containing protein [Candidatus Binataceae bacterium]
MHRTFLQIFRVALLAGLASTLFLAGCSTTVESTPSAAKALAQGEALPPAVTGFLGPDAAKLQPGGKGKAALVWVNPNAQWAQYTKIYVKPVEFWAGEDSKVSPDDQKILTTYFYNQLKATLAKNFMMVDQPGPGVLVLRVALMDATTATPGLRTISVVVPQARILNAAQSLATNSYAFVGSAEAEMMGTDGVTGEVLAEAVDQRAGGMGLKGAASFQWGDAENAMDYWAQTISDRLLTVQGRTAA